MTRYVPAPIPNRPDPAALAQWVLNELKDIANSFKSIDNLRLRIRTAAPAHPQNGMVVYADGTNWNPGAGLGVYAYENGAWVKL